MNFLCMQMCETTFYFLLMEEEKKLKKPVLLGNEG